MTLTPSDIEQKTFSTALRGYNLDEVDDFLDEVVRSMRKLQEELESAQSELESRTVEPEEMGEPAPAAPPIPAAVVEPPPPPPPPIDESAVGKALIAAQETAERIINDARSEADEILVRAKSEAETFEESRQLKKEEAEQEITRIDGLVNRVKAELADLSVAVGAELEEMSGAIDTAVTDLDGSQDRDGSEEELADEPDDHDGQNIVGIGAEPLEGEIEGSEDTPSGRRRHRSEPEDTTAAEDFESEDDSEEDDSMDDSDSGDDSEDDYFNFPEGDDEEETDSGSKT